KHNRTAQAESELIAIELGPRLVGALQEIIIGVEKAIAVVFPDITEEGVLSGLGNGVDDRSARATILRGIVPGFNLELSQAIRWWQQSIRIAVPKVRGHVVVGDAIEQVVVIGRGHAVGGEA